MHWGVVLIAVTGLLGCGADQPPQTSRYPNPQNTAALRLDVHSFGGGAGFVRNEISLEAGTRSANRIGILEHLSLSRVVWETERRVRFCYIGAMDHGSPLWSGQIDGRSYEVIFDDVTRDEDCGGTRMAL